MKAALFERLSAAISQAITDELDQMAEDGVPQEDVDEARNDLAWELYEE